MGRGGSRKSRGRAAPGCGRQVGLRAGARGGVAPLLRTFAGVLRTFAAHGRSKSRVRSTFSGADSVFRELLPVDCGERVLG